MNVDQNEKKGDAARKRSTHVRTDAVESKVCRFCSFRCRRPFLDTQTLSPTALCKAGLPYYDARTVRTSCASTATEEACEAGVCYGCRV